MAERRMFTKKVTDDDNFMSLSSSAQALYLHLMMSADDDGFSNQVSISMFKAHASMQDLQALLEKRYIYQFDNGVIVIKHFRMANALRKDRYTPTAFKEELSKLSLKDNGAYTWLPDGCQMVAERLPQNSIDKDSIDKNSIEEDSIEYNIPPIIPPEGNKPKKQTPAELKKIFIKLTEESELSEPLKTKVLEWLDYKSQIKNQYKSPDGFSKLLSQIAKNALEYSDIEVMRVMDETMAAGYKGIVWDWLKKGGKVKSGAAYIDAVTHRLDVVDDWLKENE